MNPPDGGVSLLVDDAVATIRFDRVSARNAMLLATWSALPALIARADHDPRVAVIVLRGAGGNFGAGNDIAEFSRLRGNQDAARNYGWAMAQAMATVEIATKPVIAAIEGSCYGASVALCLAADIRLAATSARFAITPAKLGALYLNSDHHRLVAAIGGGRARQMIFTARSIDAAQAQAWGLVDQMVPDERFPAELAEQIAAIRSGSLYTIKHSKRMLRAAGPGATPQETDETIGWFVAAMQGGDFAEGVAAFLEKRVPQFPSAANFG